MANNRLHVQTQYELIISADALHQALFDNRISPDQVLEKMIMLDKIYLQILVNDKIRLKRDFDAAAQSIYIEPCLPMYKKMIDAQVLLTLINKLLKYDPILDDEIHSIDNLASEEMKHIKKYITFLEACEDFAKVIRFQLRKLQNDLFIANGGSLPVECLKKSLKNFADDLALENVLDIYKDVTSIFSSSSAGEWYGDTGIYRQYSKIFSTLNFRSPRFTETISKHRTSLADVVSREADGDMLRSSIKCRH